MISKELEKQAVYYNNIMIMFMLKNVIGIQRFYSFETSNISNVALFDDLGFKKKTHQFTIFS